MSKYTIIPTLSEEALESWIWTNDENTPKGFIVIKNLENSKTIKTFKRTLDNNFENRYNKNDTIGIDLKNGKTYLVINEYYRDLLAIEKHKEVELKITKASIIYKLFLIHWTHPNPTIQYANRITVLSLLFALIALIMTFITIFD